MPPLEIEQTKVFLPSSPTLLPPSPTSLSSPYFVDLNVKMEPSPAKKPKFDLRQLTPEDGEAIRKFMGNLVKLLKAKNQTLGEVPMELRDVKEVVKRDPSLRIFVQRICVNYPLDQIKVNLNQLLY